MASRLNPYQVMHSQLETHDGYTLMMADAPPELVEVTMGSNISVSLSGVTEDGEALLIRHLE